MPTVPVNRDSPFCYRPGTSNTPGMCSFHWGQLGIWKLSGIGGFQLERCAYHVKCWSSSSEFSQGDHQCNPTRVSSPRVVRCLLSFIHAYQDFYLRCIHIFIWRGLTSRCWEDAHSSGVVAAVSTDLYIYICSHQCLQAYHMWYSHTTLLCKTLMQPCPLSVLVP